MHARQALRITQVVMVVEFVLILSLGTVLLTRGLAPAEDGPVPSPEPPAVEPDAPAPSVDDQPARPNWPPPHTLSEGGRVLFRDDMDSYVPGTPIDGRRPHDANLNPWQARLRSFQDGADPTAHDVRIAVAASAGNRVLRFEGRNGGEPDGFLYRVQRRFEPVEPDTGRPVVRLSFYLRFNKRTGNGNVNVSLQQPRGPGAHPVKVAANPELIGVKATSHTEPEGGGKRIYTTVLTKEEMVIGHWYRITVTAYLADVADKKAKTFDVEVVDIDAPEVRKTLEGLYFNNVYDSLHNLVIGGSGALPRDMHFDMDRFLVETRAEP